MTRCGARTRPRSPSCRPTSGPGHGRASSRNPVAAAPPVPGSPLSRSRATGRSAWVRPSISRRNKTRTPALRPVMPVAGTSDALPSGYRAHRGTGELPSRAGDRASDRDRHRRRRGARTCSRPMRRSRWWCSRMAAGAAASAAATVMSPRVCTNEGFARSSCIWRSTTSCPIGSPARCRTPVLIGSRSGEERWTMTATWVTQLSREPVLVDDGRSFTVNLWPAEGTEVLVKLSKPATDQGSTMIDRR